MKISRPIPFVFAQGFLENGRPYDYKQNKVERVGHGLRSIVGKVLDVTLREIKKPVTVVALTLLAALGVTLVFYPSTVFTVLPFLTLIKPWMVKAGIFAIVQTTILGIGIRACGRLSNDFLREKWNDGKLTPLYIGSKKVYTS